MFAVFCYTIPGGGGKNKRSVGGRLRRLCEEKKIVFTQNGEGHFRCGCCVSAGSVPPRCAVAVQLCQIHQLICCSLIPADVRFRPCSSPALRVHL